MGVRRELLGEQVYQAGMDSLQQQTDEKLFTQWMLAFLRDSSEVTQPAESAARG